MIDLVETQQIPTVGSGLALAIGAAIMGAQFDFPTPVEVYAVVQDTGTYSSFVDSLQIDPLESEELARKMADIYTSFAERQVPLGADFEEAIFDDLEDLYEA